MWGRGQQVEEEEDFKPTQPQKSQDEQLEEKEQDINPGKFEDINKLAKSTYPQDVFDGFRFELLRYFSSNFNVSHGIQFGSKQEPANYNFSATLFEKNTFLVGKTNTEGQFQGRVYHKFSNDLNVLLSSQISSEPNSSALAVEGEYKWNFTNFSFRSATVGNHAVGFLQRLTPRFTAGAELFYNHNQGASMCNFAARMQDTVGVWTAHISPLGHCNFGYSRKMNDTTFTTECALQPSQKGYESSWLLGYEYHFLRSSLRGQIDSSHKISAVFEDYPLDVIKLTLAAELDHKKKQYSFGFGFTASF